MIAPPGSSDRALAYQWVVFGMTELDGPLYRWIRDLSRGASESPERERFADAANALESALSGGEWLLGGQFTVSDVICVSVLAGASSRDLLLEWRGVRAYVERGEARPAYARAAAIWDRPRS